MSAVHVCKRHVPALFCLPNQPNQLCSAWGAASGQGAWHLVATRSTHICLTDPFALTFDRFSFLSSLATIRSLRYHSLSFLLYTSEYRVLRRPACSPSVHPTIHPASFPCCSLCGHDSEPVVTLSRIDYTHTAPWRTKDPCHNYFGQIALDSLSSDKEVIRSPSWRLLAARHQKHNSFSPRAGLQSGNAESEANVIDLSMMTV